MGKADWWTTTRQALPEFFQLVRRLRPSLEVPGVASLDEAFVRAHGVSAFLWDVDGTLMSHHAMAVAPALAASADHLFRLAGLRHAILSNCHEDRLLELARIFPEVPVVKGYRAGGLVYLRILQQGGEMWMPAPPDEGRVPLKKPSGQLILATLDFLGRPPLEKVYMVGDQYFTDIAGANLAGIRSIKVPTMARASFPLMVRSFQRIEGLLYRLLYGPPPVPGGERP